MKKRDWIYYCLIVSILSISFLIKYSIDWCNATFNVTFKEILYIISSPLKGADTDFIKDAVLYVAKRGWILIIGIVIIILAEAFVRRIQAKRVEDCVSSKFAPIRLYHTILTIVALALLVGAITYLDTSLHIREYISDRFNQTAIYENEYVAPSDITITPPSRYVNLIWISLESMENTYADWENQGIQEVNYIPNLTELAKRNISFSNTNALGGWHSVSGTTWTMASLFATTSGLPFSFPIEGNKMDQKEKYASGVEAIGDILASFGYNQEYLCGSDNSFAGCNTYFKQHGKYVLYDYVDAVNDHYVSADYKSGWGLEDVKTYALAKEHILKLAQNGKPFNFMMSTIDTHPNGDNAGYVCELCEDKYPSTLANVLDCADRQVADFIDWCSKQEFYKNTIIVINGDHLRLDQELVKVPDPYERTVYNAFINVNSAITSQARTKGRDFCAMDMYPTVLAAMGFQIEGNRLGIGTNLFSDKPTLMEEMGCEKFHSEIAKYSSYYVNKFE